MVGDAMAARKGTMPAQGLHRCLHSIFPCLFHWNT